MITVEDIVAHFNRSVIVNEHGCWLWLGATDKYGYAKYGGTLIHGWTFRAAGFKCQEGEELCHTCPSKNCVNPKHLYSGTHWDNMQDAAAAGVMGRKRRVTDEQLRLVDKMLVEGHTQREICKTIGVSPAWFTGYQNGSYKYAKLVKTPK